MPTLVVTENGVTRNVPIEKESFTMGRREDNDLRLEPMDISRRHAEIAKDGDRWLVRDLESRFGTFVNEVAVKEQELKDGDQIRLGPVTQVELRFSMRQRATSNWTTDTSAGTAVHDLRPLNTLLEGLSRMGAAHALDETLAIVLDSAIKLSGAERGFIMLGNKSGELEFMLARERGGVTLESTGVESHKTSRQIPEKVFRTGSTEIVQDLLVDPGKHQGTIEFGIRAALCVPLRLTGAATNGGEPRTVGVLYLDSKMKAALLSPVTIEALEALALQAAGAIEQARTLKEVEIKRMLDQENKRAADMMRSLLPPERHAGGHFELAATTVPCRAVGGDFFDYADLEDDAIGFTLADISGKGPSAALMAIMLKERFANMVEMMNPMPAHLLNQLNKMMVKKGIPGKFATMTYVVLRPDGTMTASNGGHNATLVLREGGGIDRLEKGGTPIGIIPESTFDEESTTLAPGDVAILFSDGVTEAEDGSGDMYGEERLLECLAGAREMTVEAVRDCILKSVIAFAGNSAQADDITILVVKYLKN